MERPILFSTEMVKAILAGQKIQTRRVIKPQPPDDVGRIQGPEFYEPVKVNRDGELVPGELVYGVYDEWGEWGARCPYGQPGDTLWVREPWCEAGVFGYAYKATDTLPVGAKSNWCPSIHMPREAARLFLTVKSVRVQRLWDITQEDAVAEGMLSHEIREYLLDHASENWCKYTVIAAESQGRERPTVADYIGGFAYMWDRLNAKRGYGWQANPWVWVIEFEVMVK